MKEFQVKIPEIKFDNVWKKVSAGSLGGTDKNRKDQKILFSIRNKIFICFFVPIVFMVIVGTSAYNKASDGMADKFKETSLETVKMMREYLDMTNSFIKSEGMKYGASDNISDYSSGKYVFADVTKHAELAKNIQSEITAAQMSNNFIQDIHIITSQGVNMLSTHIVGKDGIYDAYMEEMKGDDNSYATWVGTHNALDSCLKQNDDKYILAYQLQHYCGKAMIVIDVKEEPIRDILSGINLGDGSIVGIVTAEGKEIICENLARNESSKLADGTTVFFGQKFYQDAHSQQDVMENAVQVDYLGEEYMFIYSKSADTGIYVCALVPMYTIIGQAEGIRTVTVQMVVFACIIAGIVGIVIASGIQHNMNRISKKLGDVANGDLTGVVSVKGRDEFQNLASATTNMIKNTCKLVGKVNQTVVQLEESSYEVSSVSEVINDYSVHIMQAIDEISVGMEKQAEDAEECVARMETLSKEMREVSNMTEKVGGLVENTEKMIAQGITFVQLLKERAEETTTITTTVGNSIEQLREESATINSFVDTITSISTQTNLLSLNASIEAARAGTAGRGFAVVAREISKLADESAKAADNIKKKVKIISEQTSSSVSNAEQAEKMVALQTEAVTQVITVFNDISESMKTLLNGLKAIITSTQKVEAEKNNTLSAVENISAIIEETAAGSEVVHGVVEELAHNVEKLNCTSDVLSINMQTLKTEIESFKTE